MNFEGLLTGLCTFLIIGLCHPLVIKTEYHFGTRPWWLYLLFGLAGAVGALFIESNFWSCISAITGFSLLWGIGELFEQKRRVERGWFPKKPKKPVKKEANDNV